AEPSAVWQLDRLHVEAGDVVERILEALARRSPLGGWVEQRTAVVGAKVGQTQHLAPPPRCVRSVEYRPGGDDLGELLGRGGPPAGRRRWPGRPLHLRLTYGRSGRWRRHPRRLDREACLQGMSEPVDAACA